MDVITIESALFQQIQREIVEIKAMLLNMEDKKMKESTLNGADVRKLLKISRRTLQTYRDRGLISFNQIGSKIIYSSDDVKAFLDSHHVQCQNKKK